MKIQINCRRNYGKRKWKFVEECRYNYLGQELSMGAKVSGWKYDGNGVLT